MKNPLLEISASDEALRYDLFHDDLFGPAFSESLRQALANLESIANSQEAPSFENTIVAAETFKENLDQVSLIFFNYTSAHTNQKLQELAKEISPKLASLSNDLFLNENFFKRVEAVYKNRPSLNVEQTELLEKTYRVFKRNGALLSHADKERLRKIDNELASLTHEFSDNVLKATNEYYLLITDPKDLAGLPESVIEAASEAAKERNHPSAWVFTCHQPSYAPFMKFAENAELRKQLYIAASSRCMSGETDNQGRLKRIAILRHQRAKLLGFHSFADLVLEERMASSPREVDEFLNKVLDASKASALKDVDDLRKLKEEMGHPGELFPWDVNFYTERVRESRFKLNEEELRPYFKLENVISGIFSLANKLYGIEFSEAPELPCYHPEVKAYRVFEGSTLLGYFYTDFFPRASKRSGAWMTSYREQGLWKGKILRPHVSIVCNFSKPTNSRPSLLTMTEVTTLFHEFGHALHGLFSNCTYPSLTGTNVYWDFVELPSQLMENWVLEEETLKMFARHYQSGELIPGEYIKKIKEMRTFHAGYMSVRQIALGLIDMAWHSQDPSAIDNIEEFEWNVRKNAQLLPHLPGTAVSPTFSHIFHGGYAAGYYSYKWAEVLDADAFEYFSEKGLFNREIGNKFRENILSRGATEHPMVLYKRFRGRSPDPNALLRRDGLL